MNRLFLNFGRKVNFSLPGFDKRAALAIHNHFSKSNYQMIVISWFKGLWTGVLLSLVLHYFIKH